MKSLTNFYTLLIYLFLLIPSQVSAQESSSPAIVDVMPYTVTENALFAVDDGSGMPDSSALFVIQNNSFYTTPETLEEITGVAVNTADLEANNIGVISSDGTILSGDSEILINGPQFINNLGLDYDLDVSTLEIRIDRPANIIKPKKKPKSSDAPTNNTDTQKEQLNYDELDNNQSNIFTGLLTNAFFKLLLILFVVGLFWLVLAPCTINKLTALAKKNNWTEDPKNAEKLSWKISDQIYYMIGGLGLLLTLASLFTSQISQARQAIEQELLFKWAAMENHASRCTILELDTQSAVNAITTLGISPSSIISPEYEVTQNSNSTIAAKQWLCSLHKELMSYPRVPYAPELDPNGIYSGKIVIDAKHRIVTERFAIAADRIANTLQFEDDVESKNYEKLITFLDSIDTLRVRWKEYHEAGLIAVFNLGPNNKLSLAIMLIMATAIGIRLARVSWERKTLATSQPKKCHTASHKPKETKDVDEKRQDDKPKNVSPPQPDDSTEPA